MPTLRWRDGKCQAIVRIKKHGQIVFQDARTFELVKNEAHTERLARDWGERLEAEVKLKGVAGRLAGVVRWETLVERYQEELEKAGTPSRARLGELSQLHDSCLAKRIVVELTAQDFVELAGKRRDEGAGPTTVLHNLSTCRSIMGAAKPLFGIEASAAPVAEAIAALGRLGAVAPSNRRDRRVTPEEEQRIIEEFRRVANHPATVIPMEKLFRVAIAWPRRLSEITEKLLWEGLNPTNRTAKLIDTKHPTKRRDEIVPIPKAAWDIIQSMPRVDERVFPFNGDSVSAGLDRACDRLKIKDLHWHDLRHEGISRLFEAGLEIQEVALISGHVSWNTLRRYTHLRPEKVLEKLDGPQL